MYNSAFGIVVWIKSTAWDIEFRRAQVMGWNLHNASYLLQI